MLTLIITLSLPAFSQTTFSPLSPALGFNVFVKNSLTLTTGDTHGTAACGGDLILKGNAVLAMRSSGSYPNGAGNASNYGLVVGGKVTYTSGGATYLNNGYLRIGNTTGTTLHSSDDNNASCNLRLTSGAYSNAIRIEVQRQQTSSSATSANNINFTNAFSLLNNYATKINAIYTASSPSINKITIPNVSNPHIQLQDNKINYIYLTASQLTSLNSRGTITFDQAPSATRIVIFNIAATGTYNWTTPNFAGVNESNGSYMIWNFYNTTSLTLTGSATIYGTIFAPQAAITKIGADNNIGQIIGTSLVMSYGEIHYFPFTSSIPDVTGSVLPITGINLTAQLKDGNANISWNNYNQSSTSSYTIEKSTDGANFNVITTIQGSNEIKYSYADNTTTNSAAIYYRIKLTGLDGAVSYSNITAIKLSVANNVKTWPNPFVSNINVSYNSAGNSNTQIQLTDMAGRIIKNYFFDFKKGVNQVSLDAVSNIGTGNYFVKIIQGGSDVTVLKMSK